MWTNIRYSPIVDVSEYVEPTKYVSVQHVNMKSVTHTFIQRMRDKAYTFTLCLAHGDDRIDSKIYESKEECKKALNRVLYQTNETTCTTVDSYLSTEDIGILNMEVE